MIASAWRWMIVSVLLPGPIGLPVRLIDPIEPAKVDDREGGLEIIRAKCDLTNGSRGD